MDGWLQDIKVSWRSLARTPGFTAVVVLVMGLGIGVNTMVFNIANAFLFRTLPFVDNARHVVVSSTDPKHDVREMEKLRTEFYRNISHELATPLTPIVGYLRMLLDQELGETNKAQKKALGAMDDCIRRLRFTLDNLIDVTGLETGKMRFFNKDYDFLDTVRRAIAWHADSIDARKITLLEELPRGPLPGYGHPGHGHA